MAENTAFSASGEDVITRTIEIARDEAPSPERFEDYYEIDRTAREIIAGDFKRTALQFPDELLHDSVPIFRLLKSRLGEGRELYVLADTSYGSCCVDEVAASHVDADAMIHYGHACMSQTSRLPVIYVFGKKDVDPSDSVAKLLEVVEASSITLHDRTVRLKYDVAYAHKADAILDKLREALTASTLLIHDEVPLRTSPANNPSADASSVRQRPTESPEDCNDGQPEQVPIVFYIGGESLALTNVLMTHGEVYSYDPQTRTARLESSRTNKLLMRRYAVVQKAKDADVFGILVGTLGVASYLPLISHLRTMLARAQKKSYTISVGKLNPAKLANFLEIECFVLVACPENSLIEAKEFLRPIVSPYELEVALSARPEWTGRYVLDFEQLLAEQRERGQGNHSGGEEEDTDEPVFSLVTGKYRQAKRYGGISTADDVTEGSAVVLRNQDNTVATLPDSAAAHYLQNRSYRGLETRIGEDAPSILEQGRSGIARGYEDDHKPNV